MEFFKFLKKKKPAADKRAGTTPPQTALRTGKRIAVPTSRPTLDVSPPPAPASNQSVPRDRQHDPSLPDISLDEADLDTDLVDVYKRQHQRINRGYILDENIKVFCHNIRSGRNCSALLIDISPGGMLLLSELPFQPGDELFVSCKIGTNFKMKEKAVTVRLTKGRKFGIEFQNLSSESRKFLTELYGAVSMNR